MPTKRTPKRRKAKYKIAITSECLKLYEIVVDRFSILARDDLLSDDTFIESGGKLNAAFPHLRTMIEVTFGRDEPPDWEKPADFREAHRIRLMLDDAANVKHTN